MTPRLLTVALLICAAVGVIACGNDTTTATSPTTSPVTETFTGQFTPGGGASRSFTSASSGTATVTLTSVTAGAVGLGIGIPQSNNVGCLLTQSMTAATGTSFSTTVEAGAYCVRIYDVGTLTAPVAFTITIVRP